MKIARELYNGVEIWLCEEELPFGPNGGTDPGDWGICVFTALSGEFDANSVARISVSANGVYKKMVGVSNPSTYEIRYAIACQGFYEMGGFTGLPSINDGRDSEHGSLVSTASPIGGVVVRSLIDEGVSERGDLCTWAGFDGDITQSLSGSERLYAGTARDDDDGWRLDAETNDEPVPTYRSYVWCHGWDELNHDWEYYATGETWDPDLEDDYGYNGTGTFGSYANFFCWLAGLSPRATYMEAAVEEVSGDWDWSTESTTFAAFECVDYEQ